jgi:hypothetical protein
MKRRDIMARKTVQINDNLINIDDVLEVSEFVDKDQSEILPYGYSIILKDYSIINVICIPEKERGERKQKNLLLSYQTIKKYLFMKNYAAE